MKISLGKLRRLIRETLGAAASGTDPTKHDGFYSYDVPRGTDIHQFWYRSPGRPMGTEGDPWRPENAQSAVGQTPPENNPVGSPGPEAAAKMKPPSIMPGEDDEAADDALSDAAPEETSDEEK